MPVAFSPAYNNTTEMEFINKKLKKTTSTMRMSHLKNITGKCLQS